MDEIDIWRTAKHLVEQRGPDAEYDVAIRIAELTQQGHKARAVKWLRVFEAILDMLRTERNAGEPLH